MSKLVVPRVYICCTHGTKFREILAKYRRFFGYRWRQIRYPPPIVDLMNFRTNFDEIVEISAISRVFTDISQFFGDFADFSAIFLGPKNSKILQSPRIEPGPKRWSLPPFSTKPTGFSLYKVQIKLICPSIIHIIFTLLI